MDRPDGHDVTEENGPERETEAQEQNTPEKETPEQDSATAPPPDLALHADWSSLFGRVFATWARRLWGLLVVTAVPMLPITLLSQALMVAPARDGVYLNGALESALDPLAPSNLVAAGVFVVFALAAAPIAVGGSTLLGAAALLGRRISPRQAWWEARRRYFAVLTWILLLIGLVGGFAALLLWALLSDWPPVVTTLALLVVLILVLTPVTVSLPLALVEGHGPFRAVLEARRLARQRFGTHLMLVCLSYGVTLLAGTGLEWALVRWTDLVDGSPVLTATTVLTGLLAAPLSLLLACAPLAYSGTANSGNPFTTPPPARYDEFGRLVSLPREVPGYVDRGPVRDVDLVRAGARLPEPADHSCGRFSDSAVGGPRAVMVPALALVVVGVPLLGPALVAANPFGLPEMVAQPVRGVSDDALSVSVQPTGEGAVIGVAADEVVLEVCDPECDLAREIQRTWKGSGVRVHDGGALWTVWREYTHDDPGLDDAERYAPHPDSGLYLLSCADITDCQTPDREVQVRQYTGSHHDVVSALTPLADGRLLVASSVRRYDPPELETTVEEDRGGLRLHLCEDTACAEAEVTLFPPEMTAGGFLVNGEFLTLAASAEGGYAMAVTDTARGSLSVVACAEAVCDEPRIAQIRGDQFHTEHKGRLRGRFGARMEFRSDGTPVLTYRDPHGGRAHLVDCQDVLCTEFTDTAVTGPGWARPVPGLAVDTQDRVHLLTPDFAQERLVLLSCLDRSCTQTTSTSLMELSEEEPSLTSLTLDERDRPHMLWGQGRVSARLMGGVDFEARAQYLRCAQPLCGSRR